MFELLYGESFKATFRFQYRGEARTIGLKVALGSIFWPGFDEVEAWILQSSVPYSATWAWFERTITCRIPAEGETRLKPGEDYDTSGEIGEYPWTGKVFDNAIKREADVIRIAPPFGFRELAVTYGKG